MINNFLVGAVFHLPKSFIWRFSKKYIAGEKLNDAIKVAKELNEKKISVTIDLLGENIKNLSNANENAKAYLQIINKLHDKHIDGGISIKPSFLGLKKDYVYCKQLFVELLNEAVKRHCFVRIDMEDSSCTDLEIQLYRDLKISFPNNVGLAIQAYLKRSQKDIQDLERIHRKKEFNNYRLCKGIYIEPEEIAITDYNEVRQNYLLLCEDMIKAGNFVAFATHDNYLIRRIFTLIEHYKLKRNKYEFQMLYGVTPKLRDEIVALGHPMRVYVPFGKDWFGYCKRRFNENPKIMKDVVKGMFL